MRALPALLFLLLIGCPAAPEPERCDDDDDDTTLDDDDSGDDGDDDSGDDDDTPPPNGAPTPPQIVLAPPDATAIDPLSCQIEGAAWDPDGDVLYYRFRWSVDGVEVENPASTLQQEETVTGQVWTCSVTAFDGEVESESVSASVSIGEGNDVPSAPQITIEPASPLPSDDLSCVIVTPSVDPEGDPISYYFVWSRDGTEVIFDQSIVSASATAAGEQWMCSVTPLTDFGPGDAATATVIIGS